MQYLPGQKAMSRSAEMAVPEFLPWLLFAVLMQLYCMGKRSHTQVIVGGSQTRGSQTGLFAPREGVGTSAFALQCFLVF